MSLQAKMLKSYKWMGWVDGIGSLNTALQRAPCSIGHADFFMRMDSRIRAH